MQHRKQKYATNSSGANKISCIVLNSFSVWREQACSECLLQCKVQFCTALVKMFISWREYKGKKGTSYRCHLRESKREGGKATTKSIAYLGSISEKPTKLEREVFWMQAKENLDKQNLSVAQRAKVEAALASKVPRGKNLHGDSDAPVEWYTPPEFIEMARKVLKKIDLDPASNALAQTWIKADKYFTIDDDGLAQDWFGRVWCNPPYGRQVNKWLEKAIASYKSGEVEAVILLLNRTGAAWYKQLKKKVTAICEVNTRIVFLDAAGKKQSSPRYYNDFLYLGNAVKQFKQVFEAIGEVR